MGNPLAIRITAGNIHDSQQAEELIDAVSGRVSILIADRGYDSKAIISFARERNAQFMLAIRAFDFGESVSEHAASDECIEFFLEHLGNDAKGSTEFMFEFVAMIRENLVEWCSFALPRLIVLHATSTEREIASCSILFLRPEKTCWSEIQT